MTDGASSSPSREELQQSTDWELLEVWQGGNRRAAAVLIERHAGALTRFFSNKVYNPEDVRELVSETMMGCMTSFESARSQDSFRPLIFGIAMNMLRQYLRRRYKRQRELEDFDEICVGERDGSSPSGILARRDETQLLVRALRRIPLKYQIVLELKFFEEQTGPQIAELLGLPLPTIYTYQRRGKEKLHEQVAQLAQNPTIAESTVMGVDTWAADIRGRIGSGREST